MEAARQGQIPVYYCQVHNKRKEALDSVCLTCADSGLLCRLCWHESHADHNTLTIVHLAEEIESCRFDQTLMHAATQAIAVSKDARTKDLKIVGDTRQSINRLFDRWEQSINNHQQATEKMLEEWLSRLPETLLPQMLTIEGLDTVDRFGMALKKSANELTAYQTHQTALLKRFKMYSGQVQQHHSLLTDKFEHFQRSIGEAITSIVLPTLQVEFSNEEYPQTSHEKRFEAAAIEQPHPTKEAAVTKINTRQVEPRTSKKAATSIDWETAFSPTLKHKDITVNGRQATRTAQGNTGCVMGATPLTNLSSSVIYRCTFRIIENKGVLVVGICSSQQSIVKSAFTVFGHFDGLYEDGQLICLSDEALHSKATALQFTRGDVVRLSLDTSQMALTINCNNQTQLMMVKRPEEGDELRFLVRLPRVGDTIEIIPDQQ